MKKTINKFLYVLCAVLFTCFAIGLFCATQNQTAKAVQASDYGYYSITQDPFDYSIVGDKNGDTECLDINYRVNEDNAYAMVSRYKFVTEGLNANDKVFDITFTTIRYCDSTSNGYFGLAFGLDSQDENPASNGKNSVLMNYLTLKAYQGDGSTLQPLTSKESSAEDIGIYTGIGHSYIIRVVAYANGKLELYRGWNFEYGGNTYSHDINTVYATYENVKVDGYFAFGNWFSDGINRNITIIKDVSVSGNVELGGGNIYFNQSSFKYLTVGANVDMPVVFRSIPNISGVTTNSACTFEVVDGASVAQIDGQKLETKAVGNVSVLAKSVVRPDISATINFEIFDYDSYNYYTHETFAGRGKLNAGTWETYTTDTSDITQITTNDSLCFVNAYNDGNDVNKAVLDIPFSNNFDTGIVFDVTFTTFSTADEEIQRSTAFKWGFMFGMQSHEDTIFDSNVGYIEITSSTASVYLGGKAITPHYVTQPTNEFEVYATENLCAYADYNQPLTVRLVAKTDGTLELYRGQQYTTWDVKKYTYLEDLFATYSGFDFNGYTAFFTNTTEDYAEYEYLVSIKDLYVNGNYLFTDNDFEILSIEVDDAKLSDVLDTAVPIDIIGKVVSKPNIGFYHDFELSVERGNAFINENNQLITRGAEDIVIRITSKHDQKKFKDYNIRIGEFNISKISIVKEKFENVNNDTQPIDLIALVDANTYLEKYKAVKFEVLTDNAEIVCDQLRILGTGEVTIKATSIYDPTKSETFTFIVADADVQYSQLTGGLSLTVLIVIIVSSIVLATGACVLVIMLKKKRKKQ